MAAQQISPQESERSETLRRDTASKARGQGNDLEENVSAMNASMGSQNDLNALAPSNNNDGFQNETQGDGRSLPEGSRPMAEEDPGRPEAGPSSGGDGQQSGGAQGGGMDPVAAQHEKLSQDQTQAGLAQAAKQASEGVEKAKDEISKQTSRINHWMLEAEGEMISMDFSTVGISLVATLPIRIVFCGILLLELKHGFNGSKSMIPFFPKLTWESFMPPSTEISIPLPAVPLQVSVLAYLIGVALFTTVALGIIALVVVELGAIGGAAAYGLSFIFGS